MNVELLESWLIGLNHLLQYYQKTAPVSLMQNLYWLAAEIRNEITNQKYVKERQNDVEIN